MSQKLYDKLPILGEKTGYVDSIIDEQFPNITETILLYWGEPECMEYLDGLLNYSPTAKRPNRQGFPFNVIVELNIIMEEHQKQFPDVHSEYKYRIKDKWF